MQLTCADIHFDRAIKTKDEALQRVVGRLTESGHTTPAYLNGMRERVSKLPKLLWLDAASVARLGLDAVERGQTRCVTGRANRVIAGISKYLPDGVARALVASRSKEFRDAE